MANQRNYRIETRIWEILRLIILTKNFSFELLDSEFINNVDARYSVERSLHRMSMIAKTLIRERDKYQIKKDSYIERLARIEKLLSNPYRSVDPEILLRTIKELDPIERRIRDYLRDYEDYKPLDFPETRSKYSVLKFELPTNNKFDTKLLEGEVSYFLIALSDFNRIIWEIKNKEIEDIEIISIVRNNPLNINFKDGLEVIKLLQEFIIPWKRKYNEKIASLTIEEKRLQNERLKLENDRARVDIERAKLEIEEKRLSLVLDIITKTNSDMSQVDIRKYTTLLLEPLKIITESTIQIIENK